MAISRSALIPRVRSYLDERPFVSSGTVTTAGDTGCDVTDGTDWEEGAILEFQDNGEQCLVQSISSNTLTVVRGWNNTTAQAHSAIQIWRDPQYTYDNIDKCLTAAIQRLWPYAWKGTDDTVTPLSDGTVWYDLAADAFGLIMAVQQYGTSPNLKAGIYGDGKSERQIVFQRNLPTGLAASTVGVRFPDGFYHSSNMVNIKYATAITGTSDIEDDGDLPVAEAVIYGALSRLISGKELERVSLGEDQEVARSVRVGARLSSGAYYERMFRRELESLRLLHARQIPIMPTKKFK